MTVLTWSMLVTEEEKKLSPSPCHSECETFSLLHQSATADTCQIKGALEDR